MQSQLTYQSALSWFQLGNYVEAWKELEKLAPDDSSIDVMELRCEVLLRLNRWKELEKLANHFYHATGSAPLFSLFWIWSLMKQDIDGNAYELVQRLPHSSDALYLRACLECKIGSIESAKKSLSDAFRLSIDPDGLKLQALDQPELESIWRSGEKE